MALTKVTNSMISGAVINALDYGVSPTNTAAQNDAAFALAIVAARNKTLYIPAGTYEISATIQITYAVANNRCTNITGEGLGTKLVWMGGNSLPMIQANGSDTDPNYLMMVIEKLYLTRGNSATGLVGIRIGDGISTNNGVCNVDIRNCRIESCYVGIQTKYESDQVTIENCDIETYSHYAIENTGSTGCRIINNQCRNGATGTFSIYSNKGNTIVMGNVLQSDNAGAIWIDTTDDFTILNNYSECALDAGPATFLKITNSFSGYIANNNVGGYRGTDVYSIDSTCHGITFGPNRHAQSGGYILSLVNIAAGATNIVFAGEQYSDGDDFLGGGKYLGAFTGLTGNPVPSTTNVGWIAQKFSSIQNNGLAYGQQNLDGTNPYTMFTAAPLQTYLVTAVLSNVAGDYANAIITTTFGATSATVVDLGTSNPLKFKIQNSGLNVQVINLSAPTETCRWNYIRLM